VIERALMSIPFLRCNQQFLLTPDQHRQAAVFLRTHPDRDTLRSRSGLTADEMAAHHDFLATAIQRQLDEQSPPLAPQ
jgi:hypothetical protein